MPAETNLTMQHCLICYKVLEPEQQVYQPCQYISCSECLVEWAIVKIIERQCGPEEAIPCMAGCGDSFAIDGVFQGLPVHEKARIDEALFQVYLNKQSDIRKCPKKGCPYAGVARIRADCREPLKCEVCEMTWKDKDHASNYKNLRDLLHSLMIKKNEIFTVLWKRAWAKKCPKCGMAIEKNGGCDHMTCKKCAYEFCWICSAQHPRHNNLLHKMTFLLRFLGILFLRMALLATVYFGCRLLYLIPLVAAFCDVILFPGLSLVFGGVWWLIAKLWKFVLTNLMIAYGIKQAKVSGERDKMVNRILTGVCFVILICFGAFYSMVQIVLVELIIYLVVTLARYLYKNANIIARDIEIYVKFNPNLSKASHLV